MSHEEILLTTLDRYGELFIVFLMNSNTCILNGCSTEENNNFTSISTQGACVVDYCVALHNSIMFKDVDAILFLDLMTAFGHRMNVECSCIPDDSLLCWNVQTGIHCNNIHANNVCCTNDRKVKFDLKCVPDNLM